MQLNAAKQANSIGSVWLRTLWPFRSLVSNITVMHEALQPGKIQIYACTALQEVICQSGAINTLSYAVFTLIASRPLLAQPNRQHT
jgi:hypothetical protein